MQMYQTGGGIIILASNSNTEKGKPNAVIFMKGTGIDLIATLSASFATNKDLREISKHALFMSAIIPEELSGKKEE